MINLYSEGGLKMIDIDSFNKSLKSCWVKKYLDTENCGSWKLFFDLEFKKYGDRAILMGNLSKKDIDRLFKGTDPIVKEILQIWSEAFYKENIRSYEHLISSPLWHNSLIRIANSPVFYKEWFLKGITKVKHLLSLTAFQNKHDMRVRPLTFYGIISAIKFLHRQYATNQSETNYECSLSTYLESEKLSSLLYKKLVSKKSEQPSNCHQKWFNEINLRSKYDIQSILKLIEF